jgi:hypothetical protein
MMYSTQAADSASVRDPSWITGAEPSGLRFLMDWGENMGGRWWRMREFPALRKARGGALIGRLGDGEL